MLYLCDYIKRYGCPINYDGSREDFFGKLKIENNSKLANKQKKILKFDIGRRISEEDLIEKASSLHFQNKRYWPSY